MTAHIHTPATVSAFHRPGVLTAKIPVRDTVTSCLGFGPIPFTKVLVTHALVDEANRSAIPRDAELTNAESAVRSPAEARAQSAINRLVTGPIEKLIRDIKTLMARANIVRNQMATLDELPLVGERGEQLAYVDGVRLHDDLRAQIQQDVDAGSKKHHLSEHGRAKQIASLMVDFPVLLIAMITLLNVNVRLLGPDIATNVKAFTALAFAILGTLVLALVTRAVGRLHRQYKGHSGTLEPEGRARWWVIGQLAALGIIVAAVIAVMVARIVHDGIEAEAPVGLVIALAALLSLLVGFAAYLNYNSEFANGSPELDQVRRLGAQIRAREAHRVGLGNLLKTLVEEVGSRIARLQRLIEQAEASANLSVLRSSNDRAVHLARGYHGLAGQADELVPPRLDLSGLQLAAGQAGEFTRQWEHLESITSKGTK